MTSFKKNRRKFLAAGLTGAAAALAGCGGILADGRGVPGKSDRIEDDGDGNGNGGAPSGVPAEVHQYLTDNEANGYEDELVDMTGQDSITIEVGAGGQGFSFAPAAVNIDPGTEVVWEWTGNGGSHNVVAREQSPVSFSSGDAVAEAGTTFTHTFEQEGNHFYHCEPHTGIGMHGAVVVGEVSTGGGSDPIAAYMEENEVNLWEGEVVDETGSDSVSVAVGAGGQGFSFDPPAVSVSAGTDVTWEWTGNGGSHNVASTEAPAEFRSGEAVAEAGTTFSRTFEMGGNHFYHCEPHTSIGMHGVVVVEGGAGGNGTAGNETGDGAAGNETGGNETA